MGDLLGIEGAAKEINEAARALAGSLDKLDPTGIRELLAKNEGFRKAIEDLQRMLVLLPTGIGIPSGNHTTVLSVVDVSGSFLVDAWLNEKADGVKVIDDKVVSDFVFRQQPDVRNVAATIDGTLRVMLGDYLHMKYGDVPYDVIRRNWGLHVDDVVIPRFLAHFGELTAAQRAALPHAEFAFRWTEAAKQRLSIRVTPTSASDDGSWRIIFHMTVATPGSDLRPSYIVEFSSVDSPGHAIGTPLPAKSTTVFVRPDK